MKNRNMKQKITIAFGAVVICFFVTVGALFYGMVNISTRYTQFYKNSHEAIVRVDKVKIYMLATIQNLVESMINDDPTAKKAYLSDIDSYRAGLAENADWFMECYNGDMTLVNQFHTQLQVTSEVTNKILEYLSTGSDRAKEQARLTFIDEFDQEVSKLEGILDQFSDQVTDLVDNSYNSSMETRTILFIVGIIIVIVALILTIIMATILIRSVVEPVKHLQEAMEKMRRGNMDIDIEYKAEDELGNLSDDLRSVAAFLNAVVADETNILTEMSRGNFNVYSSMSKDYVGSFVAIYNSMVLLRDNLSSTLSSVTQSADQVAAGSDQVSSGAQALSQGATEQASSVEELAATINEISHNVEKNAENAKAASDMADNVREQAGESRQLRIPFDDKTFRYWNIKTGQWEIETGTYQIMVGASVADIRLTGMTERTGNSKGYPYNPAKMPYYYTGIVQKISDEEFRELLGHEIPNGSWSGNLGINDAICQMYYAKSRLARLIYRCLTKMKKKSEAQGKPDLNILFIYNMPFRGIAKMTGGAVSMEMVYGIVDAVNGHFMLGVKKVVGGYFRNRRNNKKYEKLLKGAGGKCR